MPLRVWHLQSVLLRSECVPSVQYTFPIFYSSILSGIVPSTLIPVIPFLCALSSQITWDCSLSYRQISENNINSTLFLVCVCSVCMYVHCVCSLVHVEARSPPQVSSSVVFPFCFFFQMGPFTNPEAFQFS